MPSGDDIGFVQAFRKIKLHRPPDLAISNLPLISQAAWQAATSREYDEKIHAVIKVTQRVVLSRGPTTSSRSMRNRSGRKVVFTHVEPITLKPFAIPGGDTGIDTLGAHPRCRSIRSTSTASRTVPAESLYHYGKYMEDVGYRNDATYYSAKLAGWYLESIGIPGRPNRAPTQAEMNGLRKIPILRRNARAWLAGQIAAGRSATEIALARDTTGKFVAAIKADAELTAAIAFMKDQLGTATVDVAPVTPSFNELYQRARGIENRPPIARCQSFHEVFRFAEAMRAAQQAPAAAPPQNEYDVVRVQDMLGYLDQYDAPDVALDAPAVRDNIYGPAPDLGAVYGPAPQMDGL